MNPVPIQIAGVGRYLPGRVVLTAEVAARCGVPAAWAEARSGVRERRWVAPGELASEMAAHAAREALADAGIEARDVDLVLGASGTPEQPIPDGAALAHRALGLRGVPAFSIHATCLSFLAALDVAACFIAAGRYRCILIVSADVASVGIDFDEPESALLLGDAAAAVVVVPAPDGAASRLHALRFETYSEGAALTEIRGGGSRLPPHAPAYRSADALFAMDGLGVLRLAKTRLPAFLDALRPGLSCGMPGVDVVIPHGASAAGLRLMGSLGWPDERIVTTLAWTGNCVAASIPLALCEAVHTGRLRRGETALLAGTGAGFSMGAALLTY